MSMYPILEEITAWLVNGQRVDVEMMLNMTKMSQKSYDIDIRRTPGKDQKD